MKKLLIFIIGLAVGGIVSVLYMSHRCEPIVEWQTKVGLAARIDWGLVYKKLLASNELNHLKETLNSNIEGETELLLAMDKLQGGTQDPYLKSVIERVSNAGIELGSTEIDELVKKLNQSKE